MGLRNLNPEENYRNMISKTKIVFVLLMLVNLFGPNIAGRNYLGLLATIITFVLILLFSNVYVNKTTLTIIAYTFVIILIDLLNLFRFTASYTMVIRVIIYALVPLLAFIIGIFFSRKINNRYFENLILVIGTLQVIFGISQIYSTQFRNFTLTYYADFEKYNYGFESWRVGRIVGTLGNPNVYGIFVVIFILYLVNILLPKYKRFSLKFNINLLITSLSIYAIAISQSRTAYLMLVCGLILSYAIKRKNLMLKILGILFLTFIAYLLLSNIPFLARRFQATNTVTLGGRIGIWEYFVNAYLLPIDLNILTGYGSIFVRNISKAVDNYYLQILLQYGLIGLCFYFVMMIKFIIVYDKCSNVRIKSFMISSLIVLIISDFVGTLNMHLTFTIFYFIILGYYHKYIPTRNNHKYKYIRENIGR